MLWLLNQCDGRHSLLDVAERSDIAFDILAATAAELLDARLLAERSTQETE